MGLKMQERSARPGPFSSSSEAQSLSDPAPWELEVESKQADLDGLGSLNACHASQWWTPAGNQRARRLVEAVAIVAQRKFWVTG